jgi:hypothetical protein
MVRRRVVVMTLGAVAVALAGATLYLRIPRRIARGFSAVGVSKVVLRASSAESVQISYHPRGPEIRVSGLPGGGAGGYHSGSWWWRETSAGSWGLDFAARQFGSVLVISTKNEIAFMHHHYHLDAITIEVPEGVTVLPVARQLSGEGAPDLGAP